MTYTLPKVIGFHGLAGSGKDTGADFFRTRFEGYYTKVSLADPLKWMVTELLAAHGHHCPWDDRDWKETPLLYGKSPRQLLQTLGTEWGRDTVSPTVWVDSMIHRVEHTLGGVVIPDIRFENEAAAVRRLGGVVVKVTRHTGGRDPVWASHSSEGGLPGHAYDIRVDNPEGDVISYLHDLLRAVSEFTSLSLRVGREIHTTDLD